MAFTPRFKEKIVNLTALHDNLAPLLTEMPHLASSHAALAGLLTRLRELESRQDRASGELFAINRDRISLGKEGGKLASQLTSLMRGTLGRDHNDLAKYGIQPLTPPRRSRRLTLVEQAEQLARQAAEVKAALDAQAEAASKAAAEAQRRASSASPATS